MIMSIICNYDMYIIIVIGACLLYFYIYVVIEIYFARIYLCTCILVM